MECIDLARKAPGEVKSVEAIAARQWSQANDPQAAGKGDAAAVERLMKELDGVDAKLKATLAGRSREAEGLRAANEARDTRVRVTVEVNAFYEAFDLMSAAAPVDGRPVYRADDRHYVFLGNGLRVTTANGMSVLKRQQPGDRSILRRNSFR